MHKCYIIGAGEFNIDTLVLDESDFLIACDGGYEYCQRLNLCPHWIGGEFDSLQEGPSGNNVKQLNPIKDDTDMESAINEAIRRGYKEIVI